jgi:EspG family
VRQWAFTSDEFSYVWEVETGHDRRPYPLDLAPRGITTTESEHAALRLAERFPFNADPELTSTLRFLARPDVTTISLFGDRFLDGQPQPDPILALGAAFGEWGSAVIATSQKVTVVSCKARTMIEQLVIAMGSVPAGGLERMKEPRQTVLFPPPGQWQETDGSRRATRLRQALRRPIDARGYITVTVLPEEAMSPPPVHRTWLDFTGDGRYLLAVGHELTLAPAGEGLLVRHLAGLARPAGH